MDDTRIKSGLLNRRPGLKRNQSYYLFRLMFPNKNPFFLDQDTTHCVSLSKIDISKTSDIVVLLLN